MPGIPLTIAEIDERMAALRENLRELVEQAAAYSGASDEDWRRGASPNRRRSSSSWRVSATSSRARGPDLAPTTFTASTARARRSDMSGKSVKQHMDVIGADGVHLGTVDRVENGRIKLTRADSGEGRHKGHHHFIDLGLVADVEGQIVRLSANAAVAVTLEEERSGTPT